jgi:prepilin-type N-terminal cleavage/methylation domain-containing protein
VTSPVRRRAAAADGFTLVELIVSMGILVIVLGPLASLLTTVSSAGNATMSQDASLTEGSSAVTTIVSDLREAYTSSAAMPAIVTMTATQLTFYAPDRQQPFHLREISYRLAGGSLQRAFTVSTNTGGPPWTIPALGGYVTIAGPVGNATVFSYQDANGATTTDPTKVSRVLVSISVTPPGGSITTYQESATIRETPSS